MTSKMNSIEGPEGARASGGAQLPDAKHGSAAGSDPRTSDAATRAGLATTPREVSPLGEGAINDDAMPAGKRRVVSRDLPAPPPGVMIQALEDTGAADRSLELSDDSMPPESMNAPDAIVPDGVLDTTAVTSQRPPSRSRAAVASPRIRAGLPQRGRYESTQRTKRMPLSRGPSPFALRANLANHKLVVGCRAGGD